MEVSVIIRFKNEVDYIGAVLAAVSEQYFAQRTYEIIAVDNCSSDGSLELARKYAAQVLTIKDYRPGKALNAAIHAAKGKYICVLSAHTIPANRFWLWNLYKHMEVPGLAGVYGAQLYPINSRFLDKRDLDIFSTLTPRTERHDSDFWNANSMFKREAWRQHPFDETVFELEDHYWTKLLLPKGYIIHFEPSALVYHYGHIERLDRMFLPPSNLPAAKQMERAMHMLKQPGADWPTTMNAGLTLNSLCHLDNIASAVDLIGTQLIHHPDFDVRWRMAQILGKIRTAASAEYLAQALSDPSFYPRDEASWALGRLQELAVQPVLKRLPLLTNAEMPFAALALGKSGVPDAEEIAVSILINEMTSSDCQRQVDAVYFAGELAGEGVFEKLFHYISVLVDKRHPALQRVCCWALGRFFETALLPSDVLIDKLKLLAETHACPLVRFEALVACGKWGIREGSITMMEWLKERVGDKEARVGYGAVQCLRLAVDQGFDAEACTPDVIDEKDFGVMFEAGLIMKQQLKLS